MTIKSESMSLKIDGEEIVNDINIEVFPGKILALIGPNGAGKSTILKILSGDIKPTNGVIKYNDINISKISFVERAHIRGVMSQSQTIAFDFSVLEIIEMGWLHNDHDYYTSFYPDVLKQIIEDCELQNLVDRKFNTLSSGEQKRVHFARVLLQLWIPETDIHPRFMLLDEPLANLDIYHELKILEIIKKHLSKNIGVLLILHDLNTASKFADNIVLMKNGTIVKNGSTIEVLTESILSETYETKIKVNDTSPKITYL
ncbi:MAG: heme ABC transporter ATP-binding protein [Porticoccaceae bacterium]|nr:heme ABC transporter ATP-binding protein [Porticoccaceae bacterium]